MVKKVGGDAVAVTSLVKPGGDAHEFEPTPEDARVLAHAALVFENGLGFEGWIGRLIRASGAKGKIIVATSGITPRGAKEDEDGHAHHHEDGHAHKGADPHAWQNVAHARIYVKNIANALTEALPDKAEEIRARAAAYDAEIEKLDSWVKRELASIPPEKRKIVTSHDAFGYYGAAYGVTFLAAQGVSTVAEPSAAEFAALLRQIKAEGVATVFLENMTNPRLAQRLARDSGAKIGGTLYADALSGPDGPAPTYVKMIEYNTRLMKKAMEKQQKQTE